jgi:hypothetical protein
MKSRESVTQILGTRYYRVFNQSMDQDARKQTKKNGKVFSEGDLTDWLIRGADEIRKTLGLSESDFRFLGRAHNSRGRRHYIYSILDEVEQVAFALKLSHESMSEPPTDIPDDELGRRLTRNTFSVIQREQALHIRRLTETLVDLINFSQTNSNPYYDHYLLYEELVVHQQRRHDFKRYQSSLLYVSLIFISVNLLKLGNIKISENLLTVYRRLLVVYTIFIALLMIIFLIKAYIDTQRAHFVRRRNDQSYVELQQIMTVGRQKRVIQEYFWFELFDVVGRAYKTYSDAASEAVNGIAFEPISMNAVNLDRDLLGRVPELANEITAQDKNLATLSAELAGDESCFREQAANILNEARRLSQEDPYTQPQSNSYEQITKAYDGCLRNWFDARVVSESCVAASQLKNPASN